MKTPTEPTGEQCNQNLKVFEDGQQIGYAIWYPQMGGYVGKAVVIVPKNPDALDFCFEAYVWHDGEFPFSERGMSPVILHHCSCDQFVNFGNTVRSFVWKVKK
jgi:hypothetical protein